MLTNAMQSSRYRSLILANLFLFSFSLALSKTASNIALGLICVLSLLFIAYNQDFRQAVLKNWMQPLLVPLGVFLCAAVLGLGISEVLRDGLGIVNKIVGLLLAYCLVSVPLDVLDDRGTAHHSRDLLFVFVIGIFILDVIGFMTYLGLVGHKPFFMPVWPLHVHHIWFSNLNALGIYVSAGFLLFSSDCKAGPKKAFYILFLIAAAVSILLSLSRTAWFALFFTSIILVYILVPKRRVFVAAFGAIIAAGLLLYFFNPIIRDRVNLIQRDILYFLSGQTNTNVGQRLLLWKAAIKMFLANPFLGVGTGDYVRTMHQLIENGEYPAFLAGFNQPHNMYLFALATNGIFGLFGLLFIFYRGIADSVTRLKTGTNTDMFAFIAVAALVHYMIGGLTDSFLNIQMLRYSFAFVLGVCIRNGMKTREGLEEKINGRF